MFAVQRPRPLSYLQPSPSPSPGHYRPFSTIERRPTSSSGASTVTMNLFKSKDKEDKPSNAPTERASLQKSLKSKRSMASLISMSSEATITPPNTAKSQPDDEAIRSHWLTRCGMRLHPFGRDAPYMQSYDPLQLDNDRNTEILLRRLNPTGSPSFHDYGKRHPQKVLDLGCGQGHWALHAASVWKNSHIVALDLVNILDDSDPNFEFFQGNFLKPRLPFEDGTFDFVRMANLSLAVPYSKWRDLISEAYRILADGGRLEVIDDQFFFPYGKEPPPSTPPQLSSSFDDDDLFSDEDDNDTLENESDTLSDPCPTLVDSDSASSSSHEKGKEPEVNVIPTPPPSATSDIFPIPELPDVPPMTWTEQFSASSHLEQVFQQMLVHKFGVHPRPSEFLLDVLKRVFGKPNAGKMKSLHLKLAEAEPVSRNAKGSKKNWMSIDRKKSSSPSTELPEGISAKAAGRLGISYSTLAAAAATAKRRPSSSSSSLSSSTPSTPPGLVLWPSTFIPLPQSELEMHVCKHMHTLLGCKPALREYFMLESESKTHMNASSFEDWIWDYETFMRRRYNWSSEMPDNFELDRPETTHKRSSSESSADYMNSIKNQELLHVRSLRIYEAVKHTT